MLVFTFIIRFAIYHALQEPILLVNSAYHAQLNVLPALDLATLIVFSAAYLTTNYLPQPLILGVSLTAMIMVACILIQL
jgi:hypothetical protein